MKGGEFGSQFTRHVDTSSKPDGDIRVIPAVPVEELFTNTFQLTVEGTPPMMTWGVEFRGERERRYVIPPQGTITRSVSVSSPSLGSRLFFLENGDSVTVLPTVVKGGDIDVIEAEIEKGKLERQKRNQMEEMWTFLARGTKEELEIGEQIAAIPEEEVV